MKIIKGYLRVHLGYPFCFVLSPNKTKAPRLVRASGVASKKPSKRRFLAKRNRPEQGVPEGSLRPTQDDYAKVEES